MQRNKKLNYAKEQRLLARFIEENYRKHLQQMRQAAGNRQDILDMLDQAQEIRSQVRQNAPSMMI